VAGSRTRGAGGCGRRRGCRGDPGRFDHGRPAVRRGRRRLKQL